MNNSNVLQAAREMAATVMNFARYPAVAVYMIQVYETFICFGDEHLHIHKARWTSVKAAYFICRYVPLFCFPILLWKWLVNHPQSVCDNASAISIMMVIFYLPPPVVMILRTYAFTRRNRYILALLLTCYAAYVAILFWLATTKYKLITEFHKLLGKAGCFTGNKSPPSGRSFNRVDAYPSLIIVICSLLFDLLMTSIMLGHFIRYRDKVGSFGKAFVRQGLVVFIIVSTLHLVLMVVYLSPNHKYHSLGQAALIIPNVMACRLILMLKRQANPTVSEGNRLHSELVQDAIRELESMEDDGDADHQPIESWH